MPASSFHPIRLLLPVLLLGISCATIAPVSKIEGDQKTAEARFEARTYKDARGEELHYRFLKPAHVLPFRSYPLVIFLHGAGERGADNTAQCKHGLPQFCSEYVMAKYPCFVIAPQVPTDSWWSPIRRNRNGGAAAGSAALAAAPSPAMRLTLEVVEQIRKDYRIDPSRIYVTGISMGGYGTWDVIARHPEMFAAAAPICGGGDPAKVSAFVSMPLWVFHGGADPTVPVRNSRDMVEALKAAGGSPKYTEYPGVGHDSWTRSYQNPEFYAWLFAQKKK